MNKLFTYGTLQNEKIQLELFHRVLTGKNDTLDGYELSTLSQVIEEEGVQTEISYPVIFKSTNPNSKIRGAVIELTDDELKVADDYEGDDYKRIAVFLASGTSAYTYIQNKKA
ncbi:gamma-glutamylcyclotransferase family protein [Marinigracilibium pacificum]|uniref:Gamma-glutamylcyclotransferase n=1 Tax=Marinigracilibium pacificum TaxID=2729599 RepID=A0A848IZY3_9BACT|nr:gamma-glutamylcyclotransferase family protein [Marinigracilibium pacificum]NMM47784.1 gamma-glutamylcyclotransferase [Marinigracilibium pacificum]